MLEMAPPSGNSSDAHPTASAAAGAGPAAAASPRPTETTSTRTSSDAGAAANGGADSGAAAAAPKRPATLQTKKRKKRPRGKWGYATVTNNTAATEAIDTPAAAPANVVLAKAEREETTTKTTPEEESPPKGMRDAGAGAEVSADAAAASNQASRVTATVPIAPNTMSDEDFSRATGLTMTARNSKDATAVSAVSVALAPADHHRVSAQPSPNPNSNPEQKEDGAAAGIVDGTAAAEDSSGGIDDDDDDERKRKSPAGAAAAASDESKKDGGTSVLKKESSSSRKRYYYDSSSDDDWEEWARGGSGKGANSGTAEDGPKTEGGGEEKKDDNDENGDTTAAAGADRKVTVPAKKRRPIAIRYDDEDVRDGFIDRDIVDLLEDEEFDAIAAEMREREQTEREARERAEQEAREAKERAEREAREAREQAQREQVRQEERERKEQEEADRNDRLQLANRLRREREARQARLRAATSAAIGGVAGTWAGGASAAASSAATLQAANAAYDAIPAVTKQPAAAAPITGAPRSRCPSPRTAGNSASRGTGRPKDERDYEDRPIKGDPSDDKNEDVKPRIKSDPFEDEDSHIENDVAPSPGAATAAAAPSQPVDSTSYWAAVRIKQEEHTEWRQEVEERKEKDDKKMHNTIEGKAFLFVERVLETHKELLQNDDALESEISPVARDDMTFLCEKMLKLQEGFRLDESKPTHVDIGYHYTRPDAMDRIRTDGLITHAERQASGINSHNGSVFGDGIYTGNTPFPFRHFGEAGLIVARLKGATQRRDMSFGGSRRRQRDESVDTVIGNKDLGGRLRGRQPIRRRQRRYGFHNGTLGWHYATDSDNEENDEDGVDEDNDDLFYDEVVLQQSAQVVPLIRYRASLVDTHDLESDGIRAIHTFHKAMQGIVDEYFNDGRHTRVLGYKIPEDKQAALRASAMARQRISAVAPLLPAGMGGLAPPAAWPPGFALTVGGNPLAAGGGGVVPFAGTGNRLGHSNSSPIAEIEYVAPYALDTPDCAYEEVEHEVSSKANDDVCPICLDPFAENVTAKMKKCGHAFCLDCIREALSHNNKCPSCRVVLGHVRGQMPSGKMTVTKSSMKCKGHETCRGSFVISYEIPAAVQRIYMQNPGVNHSAKFETCYLPNDDEGRKLLERLKFAFSQGLTFVVGTSMTTGATDAVTWGTIHHKTSPSNGPHGFPDPNYFSNCNSELDNAGVPKADECKKENRKYDDAERDEDDAIEIE